MALSVSIYKLTMEQLTQWVYPRALSLSFQAQYLKVRAKVNITSLQSWTLFAHTWGGAMSPCPQCPLHPLVLPSHTSLCLELCHLGVIQEQGGAGAKNQLGFSTWLHPTAACTHCAHLPTWHPLYVSVSPHPSCKPLLMLILHMGYFFLVLAVPHVYTCCMCWGFICSKELLHPYNPSLTKASAGEALVSTGQATAKAYTLWHCRPEESCYWFEWGSCCPFCYFGLGSHAVQGGGVHLSTLPCKSLCATLGLLGC